MGTGAVKGEKLENSTGNAGVMSCEACSANFSLFKKKKVCAICKRFHCSNCLSKAKLQNQRQCGKCSQLRAGGLTQSEIMSFRVKDLQLFLTGMRVVINNCTEKKDLVELVLKTINSAEYSKQQLEEQRRTQQLRSQLNRNLQENSAFNTEHISDTSSHPSTSNNASSSQATQESANNTREERLRERQEQEMRDAEERLQKEFSTTQETETRPANKRAHISHVSSREDIAELSIKQLKEILATNFIAYKGCCEKYELVERVSQLWDEKQKLAEQGPVSEGDVCKICMDNAIDCVLLDCGHMVTCTQCGRRLNECPICRQYVIRVVHTFKV